MMLLGYNKMIIKMNKLYYTLIYLIIYYNNLSTNLLKNLNLYEQITKYTTVNNFVNGNKIIILYYIL